MGVAPEINAEPPVSVPALHGLTQSAPIIDGPDRWEAGVVIQSETCVEADSFDPCALTDDLQQITVDATTGTWTVDFEGDVSGPLAFDISAFALQTTLEGLTGISLGDVRVSGGPGDSGGTTPYSIAFTGNLAGVDITELVVASIDLAGGGASVSVVTIQEGGEDIVKASVDNRPIVYQNPTVLNVPVTCSSFGWEAESWTEKAELRIELGASKALETEWWGGYKNPFNQSLVRSTPNTDEAILNPGGAAAPAAVSPGIALALFAQALANCADGSRGMIHATPALVARWLNLTALNSVPVSSLVDELGENIAGPNVLVTPDRGDIVIDGTGYLGTGPLGQPPPGANEAWAYATGIVDVRLGDVEVFPETLAEALDRRVNTITFRGERTGMAIHDGCCMFAVLVDICGTV